MLSAYYVCCIFSNEIQNTFTLEANTMNPDKAAPKGAVWSGFILFAIYASKVSLADQLADDNRDEWQKNGKG